MPTSSVEMYREESPARGFHACFSMTAERILAIDMRRGRGKANFRHGTGNNCRSGNREFERCFEPQVGRANIPKLDRPPVLLGDIARNRQPQSGTPGVARS